jgi:hypothetical protein
MDRRESNENGKVINQVTAVYLVIYCVNDEFRMIESLDSEYKNFPFKIEWPRIGKMHCLMDLLIIIADQNADLVLKRVREKLRVKEYVKEIISGDSQKNQSMV